MKIGNFGVYRVVYKDFVEFGVYKIWFYLCVIRFSSYALRTVYQLPLIIYVSVR
jgi:hypothetical protein